MKVDMGKNLEEITIMKGKLKKKTLQNKSLDKKIEKERAQHNNECNMLIDDNKAKEIALKNEMQIRQKLDNQLKQINDSSE